MSQVELSQEEVYNDPRVKAATKAFEEAKESLLGLCMQTHPGPFAGDEGNAILEAARNVKNAYNAQNSVIADVWFGP